MDLHASELEISTVLYTGSSASGLPTIDGVSGGILKSDKTYGKRCGAVCNGLVGRTPIVYLAAFQGARNKVKSPSLLSY